jgi:hypothetical protein
MCRSPTRGGVIGPYFVSFWSSVCIAQGTTDGAAAASNRNGTYELWSPGPGLVSQMLRAFGGGLGVSIPHERRGSWFLFCQLWPSLGIAKGIIRRGCVCCERTWHVCRVVFRAPKGVANASGLRYSAWFVYLPPEAG